MELERRAAAAEIRAAGRKLEGYAAIFGAEARIVDAKARVTDFTETIAAGAFASSLAEGRDVLGMVDHDPGRLLARTRSGTLRLAEDSRGLTFSLDLPETTAGRDVLALAERADLGGMSFAFDVRRPDGERWAGRRRELRAVDLHEISVILAWPAYPNTSVAARSRSAALQHDGRRHALLRWRI